jgi:hypothetical protein
MFEKIRSELAVMSALSKAHSLSPRKITCNHFFQRLIRLQSHSAVDKSIDLIRNGKLRYG